MVKNLQEQIKQHFVIKNVPLKTVKDFCPISGKSDWYQPQNFYEIIDVTAIIDETEICYLLRVTWFVPVNSC